METQFRFNRIEIAIKINERIFACGFYWPKRYIDFLARRKWAALKRRWSDAIAGIAGLVIPLPQIVTV